MVILCVTIRMPVSRHVNITTLLLLWPKCPWTRTYTEDACCSHNFINELCDFFYFIFFPPLRIAELCQHNSMCTLPSSSGEHDGSIGNHSYSIAMFITAPNNIQNIHRNVFSILRKLSKTVANNTPTVCEFINCDMHWGSLFEEWW